jgi:uncharacterized protein (DUF1697 family)
MVTWIGLLRAVNVGGHGKLAMSVLQEVLADLGCRRVRTVLQSGNAVFDAAPEIDWAARLGAALSGAAGLDTTVFLRDLPGWAAVVGGNPFGETAVQDPGRLLVYFATQAIDPAAVARLQASLSGPERVAAGDRVVYACYPAGIAGSRLTSVPIERCLGQKVTGRNWNTICKLHHVAGS